jgi:hypothetical protein
MNHGNARVGGRLAFARSELMRRTLRCEYDDFAAFCRPQRQSDGCRGEAVVADGLAVDAKGPFSLFAGNAGAACEFVGVESTSPDAGVQASARPARLPIRALRLSVAAHAMPLFDAAQTRTALTCNLYGQNVARPRVSLPSRKYTSPHRSHHADATEANNELHG